MVAFNMSTGACREYSSAILNVIIDYCNVYAPRPFSGTDILVLRLRCMVCLPAVLFKKKLYSVSTIVMFPGIFIYSVFLDAMI